MTVTTWLTIEPLDTMMVRDGRPFDAGEATVATAVAPSPSTFGGLVRAVHGKNVLRILGPVAHLGAEPMFPTPVDVVREGDPATGERVRRLAVDVRPDDEVCDLDPDSGERVLTHALTGDGEPVGGWMSRAGLWDWLSNDMRPGQELDAKTQRWVLRDALWHPEPRLGVALSAEQGARRGTVIPGLLYTAEHLRPVEDLTFVVGCEDPGPVEVGEPVVPLGGRGRLAEVSAVRHGDPFPPPPDSFPGGRLAVYLATPALVPDVLWRPADTSARLRALAVTGAQSVATASPGDVGRTRRLMWAVPAGCVYYLEFGSAAEALNWSKAFHGKLLPGVSAAVNPVVTAGFGTCLTGRW